MVTEFAMLARECCLNAAVEASTDLEDWDVPLDDVYDRNEPWFHSYVGCRLNDLAREFFEDPIGVFVNYESRVSWMEEMTGAAPRRGRSAFSGRQRFDLAVWGKRAVNGIVEVKDAPGMDQEKFLKDPHRLVKALDRWGGTQGGLEWGLYLFSCRLTRAQAGASASLHDSFANRLGNIASGYGDSVLWHGFKIVGGKKGRSCLGWGAVQFG